MVLKEVAMIFFVGYLNKYQLPFQDFKCNCATALSIFGYNCERFSYCYRRSFVLIRPMI